MPKPWKQWRSKRVEFSFEGKRVHTEREREREMIDTRETIDGRIVWPLVEARRTDRGGGRRMEGERERNADRMRSLME